MTNTESLNLWTPVAVLVEGDQLAEWLEHGQLAADPQRVGDGIALLRFESGEIRRFDLDAEVLVATDPAYPSV